MSRPPVTVNRTHFHLSPRLTNCVIGRTALDIQDLSVAFLKPCSLPDHDWTRLDCAGVSDGTLLSAALLNAIFGAKSLSDGESDGKLATGDELSLSWLNPHQLLQVYRIRLHVIPVQCQERQVLHILILHIQVSPPTDKRAVPEDQETKGKAQNC